MSEKSIRIKSFTRKIIVAFPFLILLIFPSRNALAQDELPDSIVTERLQTIRLMLAEGKKNAGLWWNGWLIGYSAATVIQGTAGLISENKSTCQDLILGAATTFLGAAGQILTPMDPASAPGRLALLPETTSEDRRNKLSEAEKLLRESAMREKSGKSWKTHAVSGAVNLGSGLITWKGFDRSIWDGLANFAINTVITEVQIFTQPSKAIKDYENYMKKYNPEPGLSHVPNDNSWTVSGYPGGIVVRFNF